MRTPVLLVPGWSDRAAQLQWQRRAFIEAGWPDVMVQAMEFADRYGSNVAHATEIAAAIAALRERTGAHRIDVVAHSMGGLALRWFLHFHEGAAVIRRAVFTATPHHGTWVAWLGPGPGAREMRPGSAFLQSLNRLPVIPAGLPALALQTPTEARVLPWRSARLRDGHNLRVWCISHAGMLRSRKVFAAIRAFLEDPVISD